LPGAAAAIDHFGHESRVSVSDFFPLCRRPPGVSGSEDAVVILERLKAVTHLDTSARQDAIKCRKGRLSCAGLDPCDD
jgi:hypothetical protein